MNYHLGSAVLACFETNLITCGPRQTTLC